MIALREDGAVEGVCGSAAQTSLLQRPMALWVTHVGQSGRLHACLQHILKQKLTSASDTQGCWTVLS